MKTAERMTTLKNAGIDTQKFFNLKMDIPVGSKVEIKIDGVPYSFNSSIDPVVKEIMDSGYVFNSRTDGRWVCAQTFRMLNENSYNENSRKMESGWDAYLRNSFPYMYQFTMMADELHRLARMERDCDPEFEELKRFFTKTVVYETCKHYMRQLNKYIRKQPKRTCKGERYVKLNKYGDVFVKDLEFKVFRNLKFCLETIDNTANYRQLEEAFGLFLKYMPKLPYETPKCSVWKDAFKGKGGFLTLLNIVKFHNVVVRNYETQELLDREGSISYIKSLLDLYKGEYWKFHELLKETIRINGFDLSKSIEQQRNYSLN